jgi:hypothetical protein
MPIQPNMRAIRDALPPALESEHFITHFGLRNPATGKGMGVHGVRDRVLILTYLEALEALYRTMTGEPWRREPPPADETRKTHVYVFDSSPFTYFDRRLNPFIVLSCRSNEPTTQAELHRAAAEAVHEATHLFNYRKRPMHDPNSDAWEWFDEGISVLMETLVASGNQDYFRFLMDWIDVPEMSLDAPGGKYQAGMFVRYLTKRLGLDFVNRVWTESDINETPIEALQRLMPAGQKFISPDPNDRDIFASGYCIDPYFIWDHESASLAPDVFVRYGERAVSESLPLRAGNEARIEGQLNHLACRYYRFYLRGDVRNVRVDFFATDPPDATPLKAEVALVSRERRRSRVEPLFPTGGPAAGGEAHLSAVLDDLDADEVDHLVLVVSNCGLRSSLSHKPDEHDDKKPYTIIATAS